MEALEAYYGRYLPQLTVCLTGPVAVVVWMFSADVWVGAVLVAVLAVLSPNGSTIRLRPPASAEQPSRP